MAIRITCYGGVGQIGGNKVLLEDVATGGRLFLDFGIPFGERRRYFEEYLNPRASAGLLDLIELGLVPPFRGLYRPDLLDLPEIQERIAAFPDLSREGRPPVDAVLLSHAHLDHSGYISFLRQDVPVVSTAMTAALTKAIQDTASGGSDLEREVAYFTPKLKRQERASAGRFYLGSSPARNAAYQLRPMLVTDAVTGDEEWRRFWLQSRARRKGIAGPLPQQLEQGALGWGLKSLPVDHSIFGAAAFAVETSAGWVGYTGDLRFQSKRGTDTVAAMEILQGLRLKALIGEGTRLGDDRQGSEEEVYERSLAAVRRTTGLVVADFGPRNIERLEVFHAISVETGRPLVVLDKDAYLLSAMRLADSSVPDLRGDDILIYSDRGEDSRGWQDVLRERHGARYLAPDELQGRGRDYILCFSFLDLKHLVDIAPQGGAYIYSTSEAHNEEERLDLRRLQNWVAHFQMAFVGDPERESGYHASGHASESELARFVREVSPGYFIPLHSEQPRRYLELLAGTAIEVRLPEYGVPLVFT